MPQKAQHEWLGRRHQLVAAGVLFLCEAVADKIPYVDSVWDAVHTVIRPVSGAVVGALPARQSGSLSDPAAGAIGVRRRWPAMRSRPGHGWRSTSRRSPSAT